MKIKIFLTVAFALLSGFNCMAQRSMDLIYFTLVKDNGHSYSLIVGSNAKKVDEKYENIRSNSEDKPFEVHKYIVSSKIQKCIYDYVIKNCVTVNSTVAQGENVYFIFIDGNENPRRCFLPNSEKAKIYFGGLKKQIELYSTKTPEERHLLLDIQAKFIEGKGFPLTIDQENFLNEKNKKKL